MLLLTGRTTGLTQLTLSSRTSRRQVYDVIVQPDLNLLRNLIRRTVPTAAVEVQPGLGNVIILSGYVTSPQDADIVTRLREQPRAATRTTSSTPCRSAASSRCRSTW